MSITTSSPSKGSVAKTASVVAAAAIACSNALAIEAVQDPGSTAFRNDLQGTVGFEFTLAETVNVVLTALGFLDAGNDVAPGATADTVNSGDGLVETHIVALWLGNTILAQAEVGPGATTLIDGYRYVTLAVPVTLVPTQTYTLGAHVLSDADVVDDMWRTDAGTPTFAPEITNVLSRWTNTGGPPTGFERPQNNGAGGGYHGPNMILEPVPEPSALVLGGFGLAAMALRRRR